MSEESDGEIHAKGKLAKKAVKAAAKGALWREVQDGGEDTWWGRWWTRKQAQPATTDLIRDHSRRNDLVHGQPEENGHRAPPTEAKDAETAKPTVQRQSKAMAIVTPAPSGNRNGVDDLLKDRR
ncbi:hypothetical protein BDZ97DRAFT_1759943 [Flammula alnicola]|nr:hypothetical protein BDZ97DRAFT_1759943 [Flammula alnicola]